MISPRGRRGREHVAARADRLRQVRHEHRGEQADAHAAALRQPDPEHELLRDPVEERAERERAAAGVRAPLDRPVEQEVGQRAGPEPDRDRQRARLRDALREQLEADRADQRPGAERQHDPDQAGMPGTAQREQRAEHERGGGECAPAEGGEHAGTVRCAGDGRRGAARRRRPRTRTWSCSRASTRSSTRCASAPTCSPPRPPTRVGWRRSRPSSLPSSTSGAWRRSAPPRSARGRITRRSSRSPGARRSPRGRCRPGGSCCSRIPATSATSARSCASRRRPALRAC